MFALVMRGLAVLIGPTVVMPTGCLGSWGYGGLPLCGGSKKGLWRGPGLSWAWRVRQRMPGARMQWAQMEDGAAQHSGGRLPTHSLCSPRKEWNKAVSNSENRQVHYLLLNDATNFTGLFGVEMENAWRLNEYLKASKLKLFKLINHSSQHQLL